MTERFDSSFIIPRSSFPARATSKRSFVTRPRRASAHRAARQLLGDMPLSATMSVTNDAPRRPSCSSTRRASSPSDGRSGPAGGGSCDSISRRGTPAIRRPARPRRRRRPRPIRPASAADNSARGPAAPSVPTSPPAAATLATAPAHRPVPRRRRLARRVSALPAQQEVGELLRRTCDHLAPQEGQTAALHLLQVLRRRPLQRFGVVGPHRRRPARPRPLLQLPLRPFGIERIAIQHVAQPDQSVRRQETAEDHRRRRPRLLRSACVQAERLAIKRLLFGDDPAQRFTAARQLDPAGRGRRPPVLAGTRPSALRGRPAPGRRGGAAIPPLPSRCAAASRGRAAGAPPDGSPAGRAGAPAAPARPSCSSRLPIQPAAPAPSDSEPSY